jgi:hypothetical protein
VIPRHAHHSSSLSIRRHPERVLLALDHQHRDVHRLEFVQPRLLGVVALAGRVDREGEAEHGLGSHRFGGPARDARARRATAGDQRQALQLLAAQVL